MDSALETIIQAACQPFDKSAVITDNSFLLIYPPELEFGVRDLLVNRCISILKSRSINCDVLDLAGFLFSCFNEAEFADLDAEEFRNYKLMRQGLAARVEKRLIARLEQIGAASPGTNLFVISTAALFPLVRYGEVLRQLRELRCRVFLAFPGEERGGRLHFMNEADGGNYLAVKITIKP